VNIRDLTDTQVAAIDKHCDIAALMTASDTHDKPLEELIIIANMADCGEIKEQFFSGESDGQISEEFGWYDPWSISFDEDLGKIRGFTVVDNFDMGAFFKAIGVTNAKIDDDDFR